MGPRSDNRGYGPSTRREPQLQWVQVLSVVKPAEVTLRDHLQLQWVHGPITVVMDLA